MGGFSCTAERHLGTRTTKTNIPHNPGGAAKSEGVRKGGWGRDRAAVGALQSPKWVGSLVGGTRPPWCSKVQCGPPKKVPLQAVRGCWGGQQRSIVPKMGSLVGGTRPPGRSTVLHIIPKWVPLSLVRGRRGIPQCSVVPRAGSLIGGTQPPGCSAVQYNPQMDSLMGGTGLLGRSSAIKCLKWVPLWAARSCQSTSPCSIVPHMGSLMGGTQPPGRSTVQYNPPTGSLTGCVHGCRGAPMQYNPPNGFPCRWHAAAGDEH